MRTTSALIVAGALLLSLAACTSPNSVQGCSPVYSSGSASRLVSASGKIGGSTTVTFPTPLVATGVQTSTLKEGEGKPLSVGSIAAVQYTVSNGATSQSLFSSRSSSSAPTYIPVGDSTKVLSKALTCALPGSRIAIATTIGKFYGKGQVSADSGLTDSTTIVVTVDVVKGYPGRASGQAQLPTPGLPAVVLAPSGQPGITLPHVSPPKKVEIATVKAGSGKTITKGKNVLVQLSIFSWSTDSTAAKAFTTWGTGPASLPAIGSASTTAALPPGLTTAIVGAKIGSQVLLVTPAGKGFPSGAAPTGVPDGEALIFVIDILGTY